MDRNGTRYGYLVAWFIVAGAFLGAAAFAATDLKVSKEIRGARATAEAVPGELVILFAEGADHDAVRAAVERAGGRVVRFSKVTPSRAVVSVPVGQEDAAVRRYRGAAGVRIIEKNYISHALWTPNDTYYNLQWHYNKPDFIQAEGAWDITQGNAAVVVAIVDTGVAYENNAIPDYEAGEVTGGSYVQAPDLAGTSFVAGYDFVHDDDHPNDQNGHGTHVAGTIAETTDNAADVAGLAHKCSIMPLQGLDYSGSGTDADIADAIDYAREHKAHVINMSFGGTMYTDIIKAACDDAAAAGLTLCAAAGNDGAGMLLYPAAYNSVIAVGAVGYDGIRTFYSSYGWGLDVVAPGGDTSVDLNGDGYPDGVLQRTFSQMYESGPPEALADVSQSGDVFLMGTSMACPHVSALAALIMSNGVKSNADVRSKILGTARDLGTPGYDFEYGYGLINCSAAVQPGVPDVGGACGDCGQMSPFSAAVTYGSPVSVYGLIWAARWARRRKKKPAARADAARR